MRKWIVGLGLLCSVGMAERVREAPHCREADRVMMEFAEQAHEMGLVLTGFGGQMGHEVKSFALNFASQTHTDLQTARRLFVQVMDRFVEWVNQDRSIRPHLTDFPISSKNVELMLSFKDREGKMVRNGEICLIFNLPERDAIVYHRMDADRICKAGEEPLEAALTAQRGVALPLLSTPVEAEETSS